MIYIVIYTAENCSTCERVVSSVKSITQEFSNTELKIKNISEHKGKTLIVPAVFVNNRLFCYGELTKEKLLKQIMNK